MKTLHIITGFVFLFLAIMYPVTNTYPNMLTIVLFCATISLDSFASFIKIKTEELNKKK